MPNPEQYTVGCICAITTEYTAARQFLDEEHDRPDHLSPNDANDYTLGKMAGHNVVIAVLPDGEYGVSSATGVAKDMLHSFPNVRVGLMVGIGGGAPTAKNDIRLGDIVVSSPKDGAAGLYQYDYGKTIQGRSFQQTGFLNQPPAVVRTAVSGLRSRYEDDGHQLEACIKTILNKKLRLRKKYSRPNNESDRLYRSDVVHPFDGEGDCATLCGGQTSYIISRRTREEDGDNPAIHYGVIASANQLMKDATIRDTLAKEKDILCFEMEAAGLMNHFPCLVIRGICDYSDSHKNKEWQGFAAMTAAAYAKDLLARMVPSRVEAEEKLRGALDSISHDIDELRVTAQTVDKHLKGLQLQKQTSRTLDWLSPPDPSTNHNKALQQHQEGTGLWFIQGEAFKKWKTKGTSFLWLHGIPGCGKTVISSAIVENLKLEAGPGQTLLYFYFAFSDKSKQSLDDMLRSFIVQLYQKHKVLRQDVDLPWSNHGNGIHKASVESLKDILRNMLGKVENVYIVLDALDELQIRPEALSWLKDLMTQSNLGIQLIVTSRKEEDIESTFKEWVRPENMIAMQSREVDKDIGMYVRHRIRHDVDLKRWESRPEVQYEIETKLMEKAGGMFRWAVCQLDALKDSLDLHKLRKALERLPTTLHETYDRIMRNIPIHYRDEAITMLGLLIWSDRPLTFEEMVDAVAIHLGEVPCFDPSNRLPEPRELLRICSSLVTLTPIGMTDKDQKEVDERDDEDEVYELDDNRSELDEFDDDNDDVDKLDDDYDDVDELGDDNTEFERRYEIRLAHFSVKEYLVSSDFEIDGWPEAKFERSTTRARILEFSLAYLFSLDHTLPPRRICYDFPFSLYCATYWTIHAREAEAVDEALYRLVLRFLKKQQAAYSTCCHLVDLQREDFPFLTAPHDDGEKVVDPLYFAIEAGLQRCALSLLDDGADPNTQGWYFGNALQAASFSGYDKVVRKLLEKGADVNARGGEYGDALYAASYQGHDLTVKILLENGAETRTQGCHGSTLQAALYQGHEDVVRLLLEHNVDPNLDFGYAGNALYAASLQGFGELVELLLSKGAQINTRGGEHGCALQAAAANGNKHIVQILLERGADVDNHGPLSGTALQAASHYGFNEIVKLLLEHGASIFIERGIYGSALEAASKAGHMDVLQTLLDHESDNPWALDNALSEASSRQHHDIVNMLLIRGARNIAQEDHRDTMIVRSSINKDAGIKEDEVTGVASRSPSGTLKTLPESGDGVDTKDVAGKTALVSASATRNTSLVQMLLDASW